MISIDATKNKLTVRTEELLTSGSVHVYSVKFKFNFDWNGLIKTAVFKAGSTSLSVLLDETGECTIPWEVLVKPWYILEVGVYGTKEGTVVLPTIWAALGTIQEGTEPGKNAQEPTPSVYQQMIAQLDAGCKAAQEASIRAQNEADRTAEIATNIGVIADQIAQNAATAVQAEEKAVTARNVVEAAAASADINVAAAKEAAALAENAANQAGAVLPDIQALYQAVQDYAGQTIQTIQTEGAAQAAAVKEEADRAAAEAGKAETSAAAVEIARQGAEEAMNNAQNYALHPPVIGEDGIWYLWDGTQYAATGLSSSGLPGVVSVDVGGQYNLTLENNVEYRFACAMTDLTINGFAPGPAGKAELWSVVFTAGETITVTVPDTVIWAVAEPVFTPGSTYWITWTPMGGKYLAVWTEVEAADESTAI